MDLKVEGSVLLCDFTLDLDEELDALRFKCLSVRSKGEENEI